MIKYFHHPKIFKTSLMQKIGIVGHNDDHEVLNFEGYKDELEFQIWERLNDAGMSEGALADLIENYLKFRPAELSLYSLTDALLNCDAMAAFLGDVRHEMDNLSEAEILKHQKSNSRLTKTESEIQLNQAERENICEEETIYSFLENLSTYFVL